MSKTVLAVDDSASIRQMVSFTLKQAGYEVIQAAIVEIVTSVKRVSDIIAGITAASQEQASGSNRSGGRSPKWNR